MNLQFWGKAADFLWSGPLSILLLGIGILASVRYRLPQRHIPTAVRETFRSTPAHEGHPFTVLMLHLAATLGVGNIAGVAAAVALGGRGAVLWCWLSGMIGIATAYAETRGALEHCPGEVSPMHALSALGKRRTASFYALALCTGGLFIGAILPANAIHTAFPLPHPMSGVILAILTGLVILGGVTSINQACEKLVPAVMILFTAGCIGILWIHRAFLGETLRCIFTEAFDFRAAAGGLLGSTAMSAMRAGIARGVFSNEAGMGTAAVTIGTLKAGDAHKRAMVSASAVFWDTVVFCGLTGLSFSVAATAVPGILTLQDGTAFSLAAFSVLPLGEPILRLCMAVLGFCCMIGWNYVGGRGFEYLWPKGGKIYCVFWCVGILLGTLIQAPAIWTVSDLLNVCIILPSLFAILLYLRK